MSIDQTRAQVISSVWQAIAQSGVDLSSIPQDQQEKLVGKIADSVLVAVNDMLDEEDKLEVNEDEADEFAEKVIWKGRPFLSLVEHYTLTSERLKITSGWASRRVENFELIRIQDIDFKQGMTERMFGIGDITVRGADASNPDIELRNVSKPEDVYEILRRAWLEARKRHGLKFSEFM
jgi:hypothetical protein